MKFREKIGSETRLKGCVLSFHVREFFLFLESILFCFFHVIILCDVHVFACFSLCFFLQLSCFTLYALFTL